jgi:hypothetical protein
MAKKRPPKIVVNVMRYVEGDPPGWWGLGNISHPHKTCGVNGTQPEWLANIVAVGRAGAYGMPVPHPPPDFILWFRVNQYNELLGFGPNSDD